MMRAICVHDPKFGERDTRLPPNKHRDWYMRNTFFLGGIGRGGTYASRTNRATRRTMLSTMSEVGSPVFSRDPASWINTIKSAACDHRTCSHMLAILAPAHRPDQCWVQEQSPRVDRGCV